MARRQPEPEQQTSVRVLYARLAEEEAILAEHEAAKADLKKALSELIKPGDTVDGIRHSFQERTNVRWSEASKSIIENLVPKTRHEEAEAVILQFSSVTPISRFIQVK